ncbi:MAG: GNAT family N-acetyltransferase [Clostridia bacterium]|nr:GNAT family N-acetyltransferase [Clostridia bacterium]
MIFHRYRAEHTDGVIDLVPIHFTPPDPSMGFGREQIWRITLHNCRGEIGQISYRDGESRCIYYFGHIGYHIDPPYRGHHYARRACLLLKKEIRLGGKNSVVITCDPDNQPSRKTCEALQCCWEGITSVPEDIRKKYEISAEKCRYIWMIPAEQDER